MKVKVFTPPHGKYKFEEWKLPEDLIAKEFQIISLGCIATAEPLSIGVWSIAIERSDIGDYKIKLSPPEKCQETLIEIIEEIELEKLNFWIENAGNEE